MIARQVRPEDVERDAGPSALSGPLLRGLHRRTSEAPTARILGDLDVEDEPGVSVPGERSTHPQRADDLLIVDDVHDELTLGGTAVGEELGELQPPTCAGATSAFSPALTRSATYSSILPGNHDVNSVGCLRFQFDHSTTVMSPHAQRVCPSGLASRRRTKAAVLILSLVEERPMAMSSDELCSASATELAESLASSGHDVRGDRHRARRTHRRDRRTRQRDRAAQCPGPRTRRP